VVFAAVVVGRGGGPQAWFETQWDAFRSSETIAVSNEKERLGSFGSNNRWPWWQEAWRGFLDAPVVGNGAGSFVLLHRLERDRDVGVTEPHNVPLQFLTDTGIIGFLLAAGALVAGLAAAGGTIRSLDGAERGAVLALTIPTGALVVHSLVDFDWDFLAVTGTALVMLGAAVPRGAATTRGTRHPFWAAAVVAIALVSSVSSLLAPWLADRRLDSAYAALFRGASAEAAADADDAHRLNPLDTEPLLVGGVAEEQQGRFAAAYGRYREAADLQPKNADAWLALGTLELERLNQPRLALEHLRLARELDPFGAPAELDDLIARAQREAEAEPS
jgi:tetratricopeptide (TPR) repeat protein